jgi:hypothetical protein
MREDDGDLSKECRMNNESWAVVNKSRSKAGEKRSAARTRAREGGDVIAASLLRKD